MPQEWMEAKRQAVLKYRHLFVYTTSSQPDEQSASDAIVDLMCTYARFGHYEDQ
jgi:hypothetical protein